MINIKISVLVPVYNVEKYVARCLESIINQTYQNLQIIVVDDGSKDNSAAICDKYAKKDNRIQIIHKKNGGLVSARKAALEVANGEYIGFVDGDDWIEPNMYESLLYEMKKSDADMSISGYFFNKNKNVYPSDTEVVIEVDKDYNNLMNNLIIHSHSKYNIIRAIWAKLFKYDLIVKAYNIPDNCSYGEDFITTLNCIFILKNKGKIVLVPRILYHYDIREGSYTSEKTIKKFYWILDLYKYLFFLLENHQVNEITMNKLRESLTCEMSNCLMKFYNKNDKVSLIYKIDDLSGLLGKKIILYGAGKVGKNLYLQLIMEDSITLVAWIDKNFKNLSSGKYQISSPYDINDYKFDLIIIAINNNDVSSEIKKELVSIGVCEEKILQGIHKVHYVI